ncbi:MAG TPA: beta-ketoacyl-ACP synthase III [Polyangiaceae bacterium]|jgi:3-oxoacyl-[acyl-carrier-protein] synthase-3|nr:beta-ketoacyl-ACP synthase III [Polyangiaceae bacterium]
MWKSALAGTGSYLPSRAVVNGELGAFLETSDEWIRSRTGIGARRIAGEDEATSDMAAVASRRALEAAGLDAGDIDLCIVGTFTGDTPLPACAAHLAPKIGLRVGVPAFDVAAACAGFLFALDIADRFIRTGGARRALVVGAELLSRVVDWSDRTTAVLFGDGAGAAVIERVEPDDPRSIGPIRIHTDGTHANAISIPSGGTREPATERALRESRNKMQMVGKDVFKAALTYLGDAAREALEVSGLTPDDVDWFVPHQANLRILENVAESLGVGMERFVLTLEELGNTSSASIPIALDRGIRDGRIKKGDTSLLFALGAGLSYGAGVIRL